MQDKAQALEVLDIPWMRQPIDTTLDALFVELQLQRDVHRSENRIESYHQLRSTIAQVNGKRELTGRTDLDVAISNHCGRLIANVVIAYKGSIQKTENKAR